MYTCPNTYTVWKIINYIEGKYYSPDMQNITLEYLCCIRKIDLRQ